jgi:hypothetical protein
MKAPIRTGAHIEGIHWVAEYSEAAHEIRVLREGIEVGVYSAPPTLFGDEAESGSKSCAVRAFLLRFVAEHDAEE